MLSRLPSVPRSALVAVLPFSLLLLGVSTASWNALSLTSRAVAADGRQSTGLLRDAIDRELRAAWMREKITPAPLADDATFVRRIYLDLTGLIPTFEETQKFLADTDSAKRSKLIDELLKSPRYGQHQADVWDMIYFGRNPPGYDSDKREGFQRWLRESFAANLPYDQMAKAMLVGEGNSAEQGPPSYLLQYANQAEDAAVAVTQNFLGVQLQCARCHDHPYEDYKQVDFYGLAAFFVRLKPVKAGKAGTQEKIYLAEMNTGEVKFTGPASDATPGKSGKAVKAKFLHGAALEEPDLAKEFKDEKRPVDGKAPTPPKFSRKDKLAEWATAADNPYFARAGVNRVWSQFMGRGIVHPVDNLSPANPPSHPQLLDEMTAQFVAHKFDVQWLVREICNSQAYQLDASGNVSDAMPRWFERARTRPLSAEELAESWRVATGFDRTPVGEKKKNEGRFHTVGPDYMRKFFGEPMSGAGDFQGGMQEHLFLNNGNVTQLIVAGKDTLLDELTNVAKPMDERVERLFLASLSRQPSGAEKAKFSEYLGAGKSKDETATLAKEAIWVLITCSEFRFNH